MEKEGGNISDQFEKSTLRRIKKQEKNIEEKKLKKPSLYIKISNKFFSKTSLKIKDKPLFKNLSRNLSGANISILAPSYISLLLFTTLISLFFGIGIFIFFMYFNLSLELPIITLVTDSFSSRFVKTFWILFFVPLITFTFTFFYPYLERKSAETKINRELPFATIHMAAISGSMIEPSKIFQILINTKEYEHLNKEFIKILNEINVYGYDLISALRNGARNSPSKKLSELLNGIATTINSGGDLPEFFEKRSQSLLFEYRLEREKSTRTAETLMDIYISVVIAAPMIFMLLLMVINISGLGNSLSTSTITLLMILGVSGINMIFLVFLHLKQPIN